MASVLAALLVITTIVILAPFVLFRTCLYVILKARYRDSFGGFLNGIDRLFERSRPCICHCMVIYSCKSDESTRVKALERFIDQVHNSSWRYSCSIKKSCGYEYFVKNQVKSKDILEIVKGESNSMTKTMLHDYIESNGAKLKKEHMWKLTAFQQPIRCSETANMLDHQYVMIISIRHSAGDGPSILGSFKQFLDAENENNIGLDNSHSKVSWPEAGLSDAYVHRNPLIQKLEGRAMELTTHSRWHVGIFSEQDRKLVPLIKEIRKKLKVAFVEVIMAAFISSIDNYATKVSIVGKPVKDAVSLSQKVPPYI